MYDPVVKVPPIFWFMSLIWRLVRLHQDVGSTRTQSPYLTEFKKH